MLSLELKLAFRYLLQKRERLFFSVSALFCIIGIALGVAALIIIMSVMQGFHDRFAGIMTNINGEFGIKNHNSYIANYKELSNDIMQKFPGTRVIPILMYKCIAIANNNLSGIVAIGLEDIKDQKTIYTGITIENLNQQDIDSLMFTQRSVLENFTDQKEHEIYEKNINFDPNLNIIIIGKRLAENLRLKIGDKIRLLSGQVLTTIVGASPRYKEYTIVENFEINMYEYDNSFVYMPLKQLQKFASINEDVVSDLQIYFDDNIKYRPTKQDLKKFIAEKYPEYIVYSWYEYNKTFLNAMEIERNVMFIILSLILMIASFNIISSLTMLTNQKSSNIAIMRTIGMSQFSIMRIFIFAGLIIGITGTIIGLIIGIEFSTNINEIRFFLEKTTNIELFNQVIYFFKDLPITLNMQNILRIVLITITTSFIATIIPAYIVSKKDPAQLIKIN